MTTVLSHKEDPKLQPKKRKRKVKIKPADKV